MTPTVRCFQYVSTYWVQMNSKNNTIFKYEKSIDFFSWLITRFLNLVPVLRMCHRQRPYLGVDVILKCIDLYSWKIWLSLSYWSKGSLMVQSGSRLVRMYYSVQIQIYKYTHLREIIIQTGVIEKRINPIFFPTSL